MGVKGVGKLDLVFTERLGCGAASPLTSAVLCSILTRAGEGWELRGGSSNRDEGCSRVEESKRSRSL